MCLLGTFAHHTVVNEASCIKIDNDVPLDQACLLGCGVVTGWGSAVYAAEVAPGDIVAVVGIGGIGANAIQGAKLAGAKQISPIDPLEYKREKAMEFGATHTAASHRGGAADRLSEAHLGPDGQQGDHDDGRRLGRAARSALALAAKRGRVVVTNIHPALEMSANVSLLDLTLMEKQVVGSLFGSAQPARRHPQAARPVPRGPARPRRPGHQDATRSTGSTTATTTCAPARTSAASSPSDHRSPMPRTPGNATRDDRGSGSSILRVLADTPAAGLEQELRRLEQEQLAGAHHSRADHLAIVRVRELVERRRRREQEISILYSTARLTALRGVDEVLESIVHSAHDLVDSDITYMTVLEEDGTRLRVRATTGSITPQFRENFHAPADVGIAGRVAVTGAPCWVRDYLASTEIVHHPDVDRPIRAEGIVSMLGIPLVAGRPVPGHAESPPIGRSGRSPRRTWRCSALSATTRRWHWRTPGFTTRAVGRCRNCGRPTRRSRRPWPCTRRSPAWSWPGATSSDVADLLVDTLGGSVLVLDRTDRVVAAHGSPADDDEAAVRTHSALSAVPALATALGGAIEESRGSGRCATVCGDGAVHRHVVAIAAATTYLGALVLSRDGGLEPVDVRTLEHAAHIAALLTLAAGRGGQRRGARAGGAPHRADDRGAPVPRRAPAPRASTAGRRRRPRRRAGGRRRRQPAR